MSLNDSGRASPSPPVEKQVSGGGGSRTPPNIPASVNPSATLNNPTSQRKSPVLKWLTRLASGIILDVRARAPHYWSDWTDAWNYRVVPATALIFFAK
jgi:boron transporter